MKLCLLSCRYVVNINITINDTVSLTRLILFLSVNDFKRLSSLFFLLKASFNSRTLIGLRRVGQCSKVSQSVI